jgi:replication fork clamp-binding protein CrfC
MVTSFVQRPNCLILVVCPANQDIANQGSLNLVRQCDPKGERTIGVITKIDIMDRGTNAKEMLEGKAFPLEHGYVGVKLRSKLDIDNKMTI